MWRQLHGERNIELNDNTTYEVVWTNTWYQVWTAPNLWLSLNRTTFRVLHQPWILLHGQIFEFFIVKRYRCRRDRVGGRWQIVWQGPRLGFVAKTGRFVTYPRLEYDCLLFALVLFFLFFSVLIPVCFSSWCRFVRAAVICSSSASSTCSFCFTCILPHVRIHFVLFVLHFSQLLFSRLACLLCSRTRYASIWFANLD